MVRRPDVTLMEVGFVGLGMQGAPIAQRIIDAGYPTTLWARRPATLEPFAGTGARLVDTLAELGAHCDLIGVCVFADGDVEEVVAGADGLLSAMRPGSTLAIHSTVHPGTCLALERQAEPRGIVVLDAPVSGSAAAAREGRLLVMVGGDANAVARARPVFETFGDPVLHVGPTGTGQLVKLINNVVLSANFSVVRDAFALGDGFGVRPEVLLEALRHGSGSSRCLELLGGPEALAALPERVRPLLGKDTEIAFSVAAERHVATGALPTVVRHLWEVDGPGSDPTKTQDQSG